MSRRWHMLSLLLAVLAGICGLNLLAAQLLSDVRLDSTQGGLYRLSEGSRSIVNEIEEPVRWTFYYSRRTAADYPAVRSYGARVRGLLESYAVASEGRIILTEIDPEPYSDAEDAALAAGLAPAPAGEGDRIFFGLVAENAVDDRQVLAYFAPEREALLEYDLSRSLAELSRQERSHVGVLTSLPIQPGMIGARASHIVDEIGAAYEIEWISSGFSELPDVDALLIIHPPRLADDQLRALDRYVAGGGRMILALDPLALAAFRPGPDGLPPPGARRASTLEPLLSAWGVEMPSGEVAMDRALGLPVQITENGRNDIRNYPLWFSAGPAELADDDLATADLQRGINFGSPGHLVVSPVNGVGVRYLIRTSEDGAIIDTDTAAGNPSPASLLSDYEAAGRAPVLAVRLSGLFPAAFPGDEVSAGMARQSADVVILADVDWLDDPYFLRNDPSFGLSIVADNPAFLLNLVDLAVGDPALLELRSLPSSARPMTRVDSLREAAEAEYAEEQAALEVRAAEIDSELQSLLSGRPPATDDGREIGLEERITELRAEMAEARSRLRDIEREFREDIDALEAALRFWTMWAPAIFVLLAGLGIGYWRRRRTLT
ncbi:GldG family protein [Hyphobacterium sp. HN65]|uniref:GldG family protein n=1 Tax=Hyphobacterium lacteum TaxID=3116575 RepID=A0ABU7LS47_9PROT|nr:GldG family protein [Hyphobacterium sp. HN65]MEE2526743.1 GldG family protein [Hyphobacterium sp. HN65]